MPYDLVTIGGGFSGLVSAARAAELGLKVAVLEARTEDRYPCSSRYTTGVSNVMGLAILAEPEVLYQAIIDGSGGTANPALARAVADNGKRAMIGLPPRARFITRALQRPARPKVPRRRAAHCGPTGKAVAATCHLIEQNLKRGGTLSAARKRPSSWSRPALAAASPGKTAPACGSTPARLSSRMVASPPIRRWSRNTSRHAPIACWRGWGRAPTVMASGSLRLRARRLAASAFYGHVHHRAAIQNPKLWPYPHLDAVAEVALLVGPDGRRFTDEGLGGVCQANAIARLPDPLSAYLIMDDAMWQAEPKLTTTVAANSAMVTAGGALISAPDIETLVAKIGVPASALAVTVRAHNEAVAANDFARLAIPRSVKKHKPMAFTVPPYHAVPLCAGITGTMGGVMIDAQARALRRDGGVLDGLYAVGTPVAGLEGGLARRLRRRAVEGLHPRPVGGGRGRRIMCNATGTDYRVTCPIVALSLGSLAASRFLSRQVMSSV
jgi:fumarate reductase flavoprotein subunit